MTETSEALVDLIEHSINNYERTLQKAIGPSELGTLCLRRLGFRLADIPKANDTGGWRPMVGTAVDNELSVFLNKDNQARKRRKLPERWIIHKRVGVGTLDGQLISGTLDVYDTETDELVDWKVVGPTALKAYRRKVKAGKCPDEKYRAQVHTYGRGIARKEGLPIKTVGIMFLPMNGELSDIVYWSEPYDPAVGAEVFARARDLSEALKEEGPELVARLIRADDHCGHCPWFVPGTEDLTKECPGHPELNAGKGDPFDPDAMEAWD